MQLEAGDNVVLVRDGDDLRIKRMEDDAEEFERKMKIARKRMKSTKSHFANLPGDRVSRPHLC